MITQKTSAVFPLRAPEEDIVGLLRPYSALGLQDDVGERLTKADGPGRRVVPEWLLGKLFVRVLGEGEWAGLHIKENIEVQDGKGTGFKKADARNALSITDEDTVSCGEHKVLVLEQAQGDRLGDEQSTTDKAACVPSHQRQREREPTEVLTDQVRGLDETGKKSGLDMSANRIENGTSVGKTSEVFSERRTEKSRDQEPGEGNQEEKKRARSEEEEKKGTLFSVSSYFVKQIMGNGTETGQERDKLEDESTGERSQAQENGAGATDGERTLQSPILCRLEDVPKTRENISTNYVRGGQESLGKSDKESERQSLNENGVGGFSSSKDQLKTTNIANNATLEGCIAYSAFAEKKGGSEAQVSKPTAKSSENKAENPVQDTKLNTQDASNGPQVSGNADNELGATAEMEQYSDSNGGCRTIRRARTEVAEDTKGPGKEEDWETKNARWLDGIRGVFDENMYKNVVTTYLAGLSLRGSMQSAFSVPLDAYLSSTTLASCEEEFKVGSSTPPLHNILDSLQSVTSPKTGVGLEVQGVRDSYDRSEVHSGSPEVRVNGSARLAVSPVTLVGRSPRGAAARRMQETPSVVSTPKRKPLFRSVPADPVEIDMEPIDLNAPASASPNPKRRTRPSLSEARMKLKSSYAARQAQLIVEDFPPPVSEPPKATPRIRLRAVPRSLSARSTPRTGKAGGLLTAVAGERRKRPRASEGIASPLNVAESSQNIQEGIAKKRRTTKKNVDLFGSETESEESSVDTPTECLEASSEHLTSMDKEAVSSAKDQAESQNFGKQSEGDPARKSIMNNGKLQHTPASTVRENKSPQPTHYSQSSCEGKGLETLDSDAKLLERSDSRMESNGQNESEEVSLRLDEECENAESNQQQIGVPDLGVAKEDGARPEEGSKLRQFTQSASTGPRSPEILEISCEKLVIQALGANMQTARDLLRQRGNRLSIDDVHTIAQFLKGDMSMFREDDYSIVYTIDEEAQDAPRERPDAQRIITTRYLEIFPDGTWRRSRGRRFLPRAN